MVKIQSDEHGMVIGFPYHDGYLDGLLCEGTTVHLALRSVGGERRVLTLRGVRHFAMNDFWEGNIVLDLGLAPLGRRCGATQNLAREARARWRVELETYPAELLGFMLSSSYGAYIVAICEDADVSEPGVTLSVVHAT